MELQIVITFTPETGTLSVSAPKDKVVAYGMLEWAKETIANRGEDEPSKILRPVAVVPNGAVRG